MSDIEATRALKKALLEEYGHFSNRTLKNVDKGSKFIVDDRGPGDSTSKGLNSTFCLIFADVKNSQCVEVKLYSPSGVPDGPTVSHWLKTNKILRLASGITFDITPPTLGILLALSQAIDSITAQPYTVKAYKYVCPRTAKSLKRLHQILEGHWGKR